MEKKKQTLKPPRTPWYLKRWKIKEHRYHQARTSLLSVVSELCHLLSFEFSYFQTILGQDLKPTKMIWIRSCSIQLLLHNNQKELYLALFQNNWKSSFWVLIIRCCRSFWFSLNSPLWRRDCQVVKFLVWDAGDPSSVLCS